MSEYQYYEFLALDRSLTRAEISELRAISTRAEITSARFANHYEWGDLKADPIALLQRYFDVFVYVANWGTHRVAFRLPRAALEPAALKPYLPRRTNSLRIEAKTMLIELSSQTEVSGDLEEWDGGESWMASLVAARGELLRGDLRPLYLAWLRLVEEGEVKEEAPEPPVPPGLSSLTPAQLCLAGFLWLDPYLLEVASESSAIEAASMDGLGAWVAAVPERDKTQSLVAMLTGSDPHVAAKLLRRFRAEKKRKSVPDSAGRLRTAGELLAEAAVRREAHDRDAARRAEAERQRKEEEAAQARTAYLEKLATRQQWAWTEIGQLVSSKQPVKYAQAAKLLVDLRDIAQRVGSKSTFAARLRDLTERHARKPSFLDRLRRAGLS